MKKGDWLCPKCDFMNFAKNTVCLQCDAKRPKRQLLPGEWECPQCNFLNYRRNTACFHCEHKRPPDTYVESQFQRSNISKGDRTGRHSDSGPIENGVDSMILNEEEEDDVDSYEMIDDDLGVQLRNEDEPFDPRKEKWKGLLMECQLTKGSQNRVRNAALLSDDDDLVQLWQRRGIFRSKKKGNRRGSSGMDHIRRRSSFKDESLSETDSDDDSKLSQ
ncbi:hypothetical protein Salat_1658200 [Sesamum alatum]|uniref:RanBP2-type domain-containing protein n=1 Tax=Sesamum alatum TaxID=300844 RepID=A0AAE1Y6J2_9LAMI|nr:hypothetical protein Salat_1658200 [Sesamum alatum]